ncbi:MAG: hypothetical protein IKY26_09900, partial [Erysipelotrichaceae bacterium]|nr:hypothetical protein [Erysipelotrichaceae bacterium]
MNNSEDVSRLVDNLKELNNELEKMNANFKNNILSDTASCFDDLSSKASNLANSLGLVAESEEFLKTVGKKLQPEVEDVDEVLSGVLGTASSFLNVIPMIEIGVTAASIAYDVLHEALRDKSMDKYYESCVKVASELSSFTKGIEDAVSMFDGFDNEDLIDAKAVQRRAQTLTDLERMTYESLQQIMHDAEEIRANEIKKLEEDYSYKLALIEKEYM